MHETVTVRVGRRNVYDANRRALPAHRQHFFKRYYRSGPRRRGWHAEIKAMQVLRARHALLHVLMRNDQRAGRRQSLVAPHVVKVPVRVDQEPYRLVAVLANRRDQVIREPGVAAVQQPTLLTYRQHNVAAHADESIQVLGELRRVDLDLRSLLAPQRAGQQQRQPTGDYRTDDNSAHCLTHLPGTCLHRRGGTAVRRH
jgi:hypothetical protein